MLKSLSTYLGAAPIVHCLENYKPHVLLTSRVADAALFLAPMVYELGWNWNNFEVLAQGTLAGHLLECGCQLTGGYFVHPGDPHRDISFEQLLDLSLPFAEVTYDGEVHVAKATGSGGLLNSSTCTQQLLYEIGDPGCYITPDLVIDFRNVNFHQVSEDKVCCIGAKPSESHFPENLLQLIPKDIGWKGWGEISYGGFGCLKRARAADYLVRAWMNEVCPGVQDNIVSYIIGYDSLKAGLAYSADQVMDVRLRMDGLFEHEEHAASFVEEFTSLYTNGPAGGGGISTGQKKEMTLQKKLVDRAGIFWVSYSEQTDEPIDVKITNDKLNQVSAIAQDAEDSAAETQNHSNTLLPPPPPPPPVTAAPTGKKIPLSDVAHSRAGDKGNDLNISIIPHFPADISRLRSVITPNWVKNVVAPLLDRSSFASDKQLRHRNMMLEAVGVEVYYVPGVSALNVVVQGILDGGVNCSRRIDRHGKTVSDLFLCQEVVLPS